MQFIKNGPHIPDELLQAHEEGKVVFFCGAGVSCSVGLPNFKDLVKLIYKNLYTEFYDNEKEAFDKKQYDITLNKLEKRIPGQRFALRRALRKSLTLTHQDQDINLHRSLVQLSIHKDNSIKLITTNFDLIFEQAMIELNLSVKCDSAPNLPIIKKSKWDSLVYLHGRLPDFDDEREYDNLVLTSGDFGLAYLYEGWAAKFVSELLQSYYVCFIGYSINDPIIRYMVDAIGAEERQGEKVRKVWAFAPYSKDDEYIIRNEWVAKGVEPILYQAIENNHFLLYETLDKWSKIYSDAEGKKKIIEQEINNDPKLSVLDDDYVGRVLWALSESSGSVMKYFIEQKASGNYDWFECLYNYKKNRTNWFYYSVNNILWSNLERENPLEKKLVLWLLVFLNNKNFYKLVIGSNKKISNMFKGYVEEALRSDQYVVNDFFRILWNFLILDRVKINSFNLLWHRWCNSLKKDGLSDFLELQLQNLLSPQLKIFESYSKNKTFDYEIVLTSNDIYKYYNKKTEEIIKVLPQLFGIIQQKLLEALKLQRILEQKEFPLDISLFSLPSIEEHSQNKQVHNWIILIILLRDSWIEIYKQDKKKASFLAQNWFDFPYPIFKRLAFFAASYDDCILPLQWVGWILCDDSKWLWSSSTKREICRLIVRQSKHLSSDLLEKLEHAILECPFQENNLIHKDNMIWLRLKKLESSISYEQALTQKGNEQLQRLQQAYPKWAFEENEQEEFSVWISAGWESSDFENPQNKNFDQSNLRELIVQFDSFDYESQRSILEQWGEICKKDFNMSFEIIQELVYKNIWIAEVIETAFWEWGNNTESFAEQNKLMKMALQIPNNIFKELSYAVSHFCLKLVQGNSYCYNNTFIDLLKKIITCHCIDDFKFSVYNDIYNHQLGIVALIIVSVIGQQKDVSTENEKLLKKLCNVKITSFRYARCVLCISYQNLNSIDAIWTEKNLLPLFNWNNAEETAFLWKFIIPHYHITRLLLCFLKKSFVGCFDDFSFFKSEKLDFINLLVSSLCNNMLSHQELFDILDKLSKEDFAFYVKQLANKLNNYPNQEEFFEEILKPLWINAIPKHNKFLSNELTVQLIRICFWSRKKFADAVVLFYDWFIPINETYDLFIITEFLETHKLYPEESLLLLSKVIGNNTVITYKKDILDCLAVIVDADSKLAFDNKFIEIKKMLV